MYKYSLTPCRPAPLPITYPHCSQQIKRQNMSKNSSAIFPVFSLLFASIIQIGEPHTRAGGLGYQDPPCIGNRTVILEVLYICVLYFGSFKVLLKTVLWMAFVRHCHGVWGTPGTSWILCSSASSGQWVEKTKPSWCLQVNLLRFPPISYIAARYMDILPFEPAGYGIGNFWGSSEDLEDLVVRCNDVGVTVIANIVLNHFTRHGSKSSLGHPIHKPGPCLMSLLLSLFTGQSQTQVLWISLMCRSQSTISTQSVKVEMCGTMRPHWRSAHLSTLDCSESRRVLGSPLGLPRICVLTTIK